MRKAVCPCEQQVRPNPEDGWLLPSLAVLSAATATYFFWNALQATYPVLRPSTPTEPTFTAPTGPDVVNT